MNIIKSFINKLSMDYIIIVHNNFIYKISKEPYETDENTYFRGWYIIKNYNDINDEIISEQKIVIYNLKELIKLESEGYAIKNNSIAFNTQGGNSHAAKEKIVI